MSTEAAFATDAFGTPINLDDFVVYRQKAFYFIIGRVMGFGPKVINPALRKVLVKPLRSSGEAYTLPNEVVKVYAVNCLLKASFTPT